MNRHETLHIASKANLRFRQLKSALRVSGGKRAYTILLGEKLISEWFKSIKIATWDNLLPMRWLRLKGKGHHLAEREFPLETWELEESLMSDISDMASPPSIALLMAMADGPTNPIADRAIVPWGIQDPGNLGAILRSAAAFGFQEAILGPGCTDPFSPKALRGSMGAAFLMPLRRFSQDHFNDGRWVALDSGAGAVPFGSVDLSEPLRLMVGNEGNGWRDAELPSHCVRTAIYTSGVESLNAAVAAGIACYEVSKRWARK